MRRLRSLALLPFLLAVACSGKHAPRAPADIPGGGQRGEASWYGAPHHGRPTASGEIYDMGELTAAHPTLPFGTLVEVTNLRNGRSVIVRINDRGPFVRGRIIDLSREAARRLDMIGDGAAPVVVVVQRAKLDSRGMKPSHTLARKPVVGLAGSPYPAVRSGDCHA